MQVVNERLRAPFYRVANGTQERWFVLDFVGVNPPTSHFPSGGGLLKNGAGWEGDTRDLQPVQSKGKGLSDRLMMVRYTRL
jgi:hypothetical protein